MRCPSFEELLNYLDGRAAASESEVVRAHFEKGCESCNANRAWYLQVKAIAATDNAIEPPAWVLKRAFRVFETPREKKNFIARAGRLIASLAFDSFARPALAHARSAAASGRQLLYKAGDFGIDLQINSADEKSAEITGQVLREGEMAFESVKSLALTLIREGEAQIETTTNDRGEFTIRAVDCGRYDLQIEAEQLSIMITGLDIA